MKVNFAIPVLEGGLRARCHQSLVATYRLLRDNNIAYDEMIVEGYAIPVARNTLTAMFLQDQEATDLFFIDCDVGFDPLGALAVIQAKESIVGGIYPLKRDGEGYPVVLRTDPEDGRLYGRDGLIEAKRLVGGFLRIKRPVFQLLAQSYPELKYGKGVIEVAGCQVDEAYDYFGMGAYSKEYRTEDWAFCDRWTALGGTLWVVPDINFDHVGIKSYSGNLHKYLLRLPGGAEDPARVQEALV